MAQNLSPEEIAKSGTEHAHQAALFCWANIKTPVCPELQMMFAIPNGEARGDTARTCAIRGAKLKAEGVKSGVPDIFLPVARHDMHGLFIEMKKPGGKPSKEQKTFGKRVQNEKYGFCICDSWEKARDVLIMYLSS